MDWLDAFDKAYPEFDKRVMSPLYYLDQALRLRGALGDSDPSARKDARWSLDLRNPERRKEVELEIVGIAALANPIAGVAAGAGAVFFELGIREGQRDSLPWLSRFIRSLTSAHPNDRLGNGPHRYGKALARPRSERDPVAGQVFDPPRPFREADDRSAPAWQAFTREAARHQRLLRQLAVADRLHSLPARKMALLDYRSTYPGGIVIRSTGQASRPKLGEKQSSRRLPSARQIRRPSSIDARAAVIARAIKRGQFMDPRLSASVAAVQGAMKASSSPSSPPASSQSKRSASPDLTLEQLLGWKGH